MTTGTDLAKRMADYAHALRERGAICTDTVENAFASVPRHTFIPGFYDAGRYTPVPANPGNELLDRVYSDVALMTHQPHDVAGRPSSSSQPRVVATMIEALDLRPGMRVLEIGAGTGYNACLIATITEADVITVDVSDIIVAEATAGAERAHVKNVTALVADGYHGHPEGGPFDRIVVTCGVTGVSPHWLTQLTDDGLILAPTVHGGFHPTLRITRHDHRLIGQGVASSDFMHAEGPLYAWPGNQTPAQIAPLPSAELTSRPDSAPVLADDRYYDLWFHLGAHDPRTTRAYLDGLNPALGMVCLHQPAYGTAWIQRDGAIRFTGHAQLADDLAAHLRAWEDLGHPRITDWRCAFTHSHATKPLWHTIDWKLSQDHTKRS